jgi:hypothetical protein
LTNGAITSSVSHWYFGRSCLTLAVILAIALYGFRTALGNQPAFPSGWLRVEAEGTP